jgi:hypothetical protein
VQGTRQLTFDLNLCACIVQTYIVRRCLFADSWASANAGALDMELYDTTTASTLSVYDCVFRNCTAGGGGGGIYIIFQSETREFVGTVRCVRVRAGGRLATKDTHAQELHLRGQQGHPRRRAVLVRRLNERDTRHAAPRLQVRCFAPCGLVAAVRCVASG